MNEIRCSSRANKGIPPKRLADFSGHQREEQVVTDNVNVQNIIQEGNHSVSMEERLQTSGMENNLNDLTLDKRSQTKSRQSVVSQINLELGRLQEEKQFLERQRLISAREYELKKQLLEENGGGSSYGHSVCEPMYEDPNNVRRWIEDTEGSFKFKTKGSLCRGESVQDIVTSVRGIDKSVQGKDTECHQNTSNKDNVLVHKILLDIASSCVKNTENITKLCTRQKMRELPTFTGDLVDWPIFIGEYKRSTETFNLTQYENLIRLDRSLKGRARETVKVLLTSPDNVPKIINMLELNFGRPEWIVLSLMERVKKFTNISEDKIQSCIAFSNAVTNMVVTMKNVNCSLYLFNPELLTFLVDKLPPIQKYNWGKFKQTKDLHGVPTTLEDFASWYEEEINAVAAITNPFSKSKLPLRREVVMGINEVRDADKPHGCVFCKDDSHDIKKCQEFLNRNVKERRKEVANLKLCFLCLKVGHMANRCYTKNRCGTNGCKGRHSYLLHLEEKEYCENKDSDVQTDFCGSLNKYTESVMLRIAPVVLRGPEKEVHTFALFDEGSTCTLIEEELAEDLKISGPIYPLCFQWTKNITHFEDTSRRISVEVAADMKNTKYFKLQSVCTVRNLNLPRQKIDVKLLSEKFPHLDYEFLKKIEDVKPKILIGQDNCGLIVPRQIIQPRLNQPIMSRAKLGWTIHGNLKGISSINKPFHVHFCCHQDEDLHNLVKNSFKLENFGLNVEGRIVKSVEDKRALEIMEKSLTYVENRYEIGHLYKNKDETFPDSKSNALKRLFCMERKMSKNEEFAKQYCEKIAEYVQKGYARKLDDCELTENPKDWYLPHFAVWNINKPGKLRLVFDAAAKSYGKSLNDFLLQGPDFVPSLISILWRFRQGKIAFSGDIKEMFHQVLIKEEDRCSQRFFWRDGYTEEKPQVYQMNVMIFGAVSSPSKAQFVKNKNAENFEIECPGILRAISKQHYVDDYLDSCDSEEEAIKCVKQVIFVHQKGGFEMTKWISNSKRVVESVPEHLRAQVFHDLKIDSENTERTLGLSWSPVNDEFVFELNFKKIPVELSNGFKIPTKREVLRIVMSVFDPIGFLAPIIIKARVLMQNIWKSRIDWDSEIPENLFELWQNWLKDLYTLAPIRIKRCYFPTISQPKEVEIHMFCDASEKAYATVAFLRIKIGNDIHTSFVTSKFKVAPINQQTIPKLELQGAVLACRVAQTLCKELEYKISNVYYWTDSLVVLHQIRSECRRFPMFVACRLGEIHENTDVEQWRWVPSDQNVADMATKEFKDVDLNPGSSWFSGPKFLQLPQDYWPEEPSCKTSEIDTKVVCLKFEKPQDLLILPDILRFSKFLRLIRATAWVLNFKNMVKQEKINRPQEPLLGVDDLDEALRMWVRKSQSDDFKDELAVLKKKSEVSKSSRIFKLSPFLDQKGIIRLRGRFPESPKLELDFDTRNPVILDSKNRFTQLLVYRYHEEVHHNGVETVINNLRRKYWILHIRSAVKRCFKTCQICILRKCKPIPPEMGFLPEERLESHVFPFSYVGIDFFGPMTVSIGRRIEKRYGVLFTCLTLRAVHIELAATLNTSSTIMAIRRFISRRGQPVKMFSDNGTNFVGAERELRECIQSLDQSKISNELSAKGITWKFNPPAAANMGGCWERLVRSIKTSLKTVLKSVNPKEEVLQTLLLEIEYTINSRPLTHVSIDPNDCEAITPNHFLLLRSNNTRIVEETPSEKISKKHWRFAEYLANSYWKRWITEYRPTLIRRQKWHSKSENLKVNDLVIILDEKAPRNEWLMGKINEVYPGKDGTVRVATVITKKGIFKRPVTKLCVIPTTNSST